MYLNGTCPTELHSSTALLDSTFSAELLDSISVEDSLDFIESIEQLDPSTVPEELDFSDSGTGVLSAETEFESSPHAAKVRRVAAKVACAIVLIFIISFPFHVSFLHFQTHLGFHSFVQQRFLSAVQFQVPILPVSACMPYTLLEIAVYSHSKLNI